MKTLLPLLIALIISGCRSPYLSGNGTPPLLTYGGVVTQSSTNYLLFTLSNASNHAISFYEITPKRTACAIELMRNGSWSNINTLGYCATGWDAIILSPGASHAMLMEYIPIPETWRIGMSYWSENCENTKVVYAGPLEPILNKAQQSGAGYPPQGVGSPDP